jgi:polysaccharide transporter, PST family
MKQSRKTLAVNTVMLYLLNFSSYLFAFLLVPYETRVLGQEIFGIIGLATTIMGYFQLVIGFGFMLSATEAVSLNRDDISYVSSMVWSILVLKIALSIGCMMILGGIAFLWPKAQVLKEVLLPYFLSTVLNALIPDFLFRGLEKMKIATYRTLVVRTISVATIFIVVKKAGDYVYIPWILTVEAFLALVISFWYARTGCGLQRSKIDLSGIKREFKRSSLFFLSRISSSVYSTSNTVVLSATCSMAQVGLYSAAGKLIVTGQTMLQPLADSLYPYMVKNKDFRLARRVLLIGVPLWWGICLLTAVLAKPIVTLLLGSAFSSSADIFRLLVPVVAFSLPNYIIAFPVLGALGLSVKSNYANFVGAAAHVVQLTMLALLHRLTPLSVATAYSITEFCVLLYRIGLLSAAIKKRKETARVNDENRVADTAVYR